MFVVHYCCKNLWNVYAYSVFIAMYVHLSFSLHLPYYLIAYLITCMLTYTTPCILSLLPVWIGPSCVIWKWNTYVQSYMYFCFHVFVYLFHASIWVYGTCILQVLCSWMTVVVFWNISGSASAQTWKILKSLMI